MTEPVALASGDVVRLDDVMIAMRDGTHLATDIYLPAKNGKPLPGPHPEIGRAHV